MAKRYGRNQRRKHREEMARLRAVCTKSMIHAQQAEWNAQQAEEHAFQRFMRASGLMKLVLDRMASQIGFAAGEQMLKEFSSVAVKRQKSVTVSMWGDRFKVSPIKTIEIRLPELRLRCAITDLELESAHD